MHPSLFTMGLSLNITVHQAEDADVPELCKLLALLFTQEEEFRADSLKQQNGLSMIINHPEAGVILIARHEGRVIGMVNLLFTISTTLGGKVVMLEDMVVLPAYRGQGVGRHLLSAAVSRVRSEGFLRITLLTDRLNDEAQSFYRSLGFEQSTMVPMRLIL
jgi:GNAT superfamily N-acetyltransferase